MVEGTWINNNYRIDKIRKQESTVSDSRNVQGTPFYRLKENGP